MQASSLYTVLANRQQPVLWYHWKLSPAGNNTKTSFTGFCLTLRLPAAVNGNSGVCHNKSLTLFAIISHQLLCLLPGLSACCILCWPVCCCAPGLLQLSFLKGSLLALSILSAFLYKHTFLAPTLIKNSAPLHGNSPIERRGSEKKVTDLVLPFNASITDASFAFLLSSGCLFYRSFSFFSQTPV